MNRRFFLTGVGSLSLSLLHLRTTEGGLFRHRRCCCPSTQVNQCSNAGSIPIIRAAGDGDPVRADTKYITMHLDLDGPDTKICYTLQPFPVGSCYLVEKSRIAFYRRGRFGFVGEIYTTSSNDTWHQNFLVTADGGTNYLPAFPDDTTFGHKISAPMISKKMPGGLGGAFPGQYKRYSIDGSGKFDATYFDQINFVTWMSSCR